MANFSCGRKPALKPASIVAMLQAVAALLVAVFDNKAGADSRPLTDYFSGNTLRIAEMIDSGFSSGILCPLSTHI